jgi:hypothetical protein
MCRLWICTIFVALLGSTATTLHAADCPALKQLQLPDTTITTAETNTSGDLDRPGMEKTLHNLPPFCLVAGVLHPTAD